MKASLIVVSCLALVAAVCGQYEMTFGGSVPQSDVLGINVIQQSTNMVCLNVEITEDILIKGFEYYVSYAWPQSSLTLNFLKTKDCNANCADYLLNMSTIPFGTLDTVSEQLYRIATDKAGYRREYLPSDETELVPKGAILGFLFGHQNDSSVLGIDPASTNPYSDKFALVDDNAQGISLQDIQSGQKWRYLIRIIGNPLRVDSEKGFFVGWNIGSDWDSALIPTYTPYAGLYVITTVKMPKNTLITGFNIHGHTAGQVRIKFISFTECQKPNVNCEKYLETLSTSSEALPNTAYKVKFSSFPIPLADGLLRYDLPTPFYAQEDVYLMIDQSLGGRISIDTSRPSDPQSDYAFEANKIAKLSKKSDANWKFAIRVLAVPFELVSESTTTTTTPGNKSPTNAASLGFTLLAAIMLLSQLL